MRHEMLANVCRLIMAQVDLGIDVQYWGKQYTDADGKPMPDATAAQLVDSPAEQPAPAAKGPTERRRWVCAGA